MQSNPRIASKLQENPVNTNNPRRGSCTFERNNEIKTGIAKDGTFVHISSAQIRDKSHHTGDFLNSEDTVLVPGYLGSSKIKGTIFINKRLKKVGFRDYSSNKFRTAMTMDDERIRKLGNADFHLFPNAGKP